MSGGVTGTHVAGESGWISDSNAQDNAILRLKLKRYNVRDYGATGDGVTDDTTAVATATTAMVGNGSGILYFPAGTYKVTNLPDLVPPVATGPMPYCVRGDGNILTTIMHYGTSLANTLSISNPSFDPNNPSDSGPKWGGFTIDGTNSTGGCSGIQIGDISKLNFEDTVIQNFTSTGAKGWYFFSGYGWCERIAVTGSSGSVNNTDLFAFGVGLGTPNSTTSATLASGTAYTAVPVNALTNALYSGETFVIWPGSGTATQTLTTTAAVAAGATSIPVTSFTASQSYPSGTTTVTRGAYGSFDYHDVNMYLKANGNQNGFISYVPMGKNAQIDRVGATYRFTGNFQSTGSTNSGSVFRLMGTDHCDCTWNVSIEGDGSNTGRHVSVKIDTSNGAYLGGTGTFSLAGTATASFAGGTYQFSVAGNVLVSGITTSTSPGGFNKSITGKYMQRLLHNNVPVGGGGNYPSSITSGTSFQNTIVPDGQPVDVLVTIPIAFTGTSTVTASWGTFSGIAAGTTTLLAGTAGQTLSLTVPHYANYYLRVDLGTPANATIGTPVPFYV
jgi:hypothetical protein